MPNTPIRAIVIHCTASATTTTRAKVDSWHKARGFSGIGYHWLVRESAEGPVIEAGRAESVQGAHAVVGGYNVRTIGICCAGDPRGGHPWSPEQRKALVALIADRCQAHGLTSADVYGHCETDPEHRPDCPGVDMDALRADVAVALGER